MYRHIDAVVGRYKGKIWDVANEVTTFSWSNGNSALNRNQNYWQAMGEEWLDKAFTRAKQADPECLFIYNDNYHEYMTEIQVQVVYDLILRLVARNVPVDGVGFQCHYYDYLAQPPHVERLTKWFRKFADLGLYVIITEMDINICTGSGDSAALAVQAEYYRDVLDVCLKEPKCLGMLLWGIWDGDTWMEGTYWGGCENANPLLFDREYLPKPAYYAVRERLKAGRGNGTIGPDRMAQPAERKNTDNPEWPERAFRGRLYPRPNCPRVRI
jgi:endo-1,4-beta-xylanase